MITLDHKPHFSDATNAWIKEQCLSVPHFVPPSPAAVLGNTAKQSGHFDGSSSQTTRKTLFKHQRSAAELLGSGSRTGLCLWAVASKEYGVDVIHNFAEKKSRFNGLQTCGSVWACPCCSAKISSKRCDEMNKLLAWSRRKGYSVVMLTLTTRHDKKDDLLELLNQLKAAKHRFSSHRAYKAFKKKLIGSVTATEIQGGGWNGWHPHFHLILVLDMSQEDAIVETEKLRSAWLSSLESQGLSGTDAAFDVQDATFAGKYIAKFGAAEELTLSKTKKSRGSGSRNPFQLLADYSEHGDKHAGQLFKEYASVFKGRQQLVWSNGLKKMAQVEVLTDDEVAELDDLKACDEKIGHLTPTEWKTVRHERAGILTMSEKAGPDGVDTFVRIVQKKFRADMKALKAKGLLKPAAPDLVPKPRPPRPKAKSPEVKKMPDLDFGVSGACP